MFTAAEFRLIRERCPDKLNVLLKNLGIEKPNWNDDKEFEIYAKLDDEIVNRICRRMKSESIIEGYTNLMTLGGLHFDYSETDNELLSTILADKEKIQNGLEEKLTEAETFEPVVEVENEVYDYSRVEIEFSRAEFKLGFPLNFELRNRKILGMPPALAMQIKNLICEYFTKKEPFNIIEAIEVSINTRNGTAAEYGRVKNNILSKDKPTPEPPPFNQDELSEVMDSLKLVEDVVKSID